MCVWCVCAQVPVVEKADSSSVLPRPLSISTKNRMTFLFANLKDRDFLVQRISDFLQQTAPRYLERELTGSLTSSEDEVHIWLTCSLLLTSWRSASSSVWVVLVMECICFGYEVYSPPVPRLHNCESNQTTLFPLSPPPRGVPRVLSCPAALRGVWAPRGWRSSANSTSTTTAFPQRHRPS